MSNETNMDTEMMDECIQFIESIKDKYNINCMFIAVQPVKANPIVTYHGEQLDYSELVCKLSTRLRNLVAQRLDMT